jgi:hypothetical protein
MVPYPATRHPFSHLTSSFCQAMSKQNFGHFVRSASRGFAGLRDLAGPRSREREQANPRLAPGLESRCLPYFPVLDPVRSVHIVSDSAFQIGLVLGIVAFEPLNLAVAFKGQHMGGDAVEKPAVM